MHVMVTATRERKICNYRAHGVGSVTIIVNNKMNMSLCSALKLWLCN